MFKVCSKLTQPVSTEKLAASILSTHIKATVIKVKNINDIGLVFFDNQESELISEAQRLLTSFISAMKVLPVLAKMALPSFLFQEQSYIQRVQIIDLLLY